MPRVMRRVRQRVFDGMSTDRTRSELEATARWLDMAYLPKTASAVRALVRFDLRTARDWHEPVVKTYRVEHEKVSGPFNY